MRQTPVNDTRTATVTDRNWMAMPSDNTHYTNSATFDPNYATFAASADVPYVITTTSTGPSDWTSVSPIQMDLSDETYQKILQKVMSEFSKRPVVEHKCRNCGAVLEMDANKPIFICKYCGTTYAVGTAHIHDKGD